MLNEIKARLKKVKQDNVTNFVQKEHADIEWLVNRIEKYVRANIKLTELKLQYETALKEIIEVDENSFEDDCGKMLFIAKEALKDVKK